MNITKQEKRWIELIIDSHPFPKTALLEMRNKLLTATNAELEDVWIKTIAVLKNEIIKYKNLPINKTEDEWVEYIIEIQSINTTLLYNILDLGNAFKKGGIVIGDGNAGFGAEPIISESMRKPVILDKEYFEGGEVSAYINIKDLLSSKLSNDKKGSDTSGKG